MNCFGIFGRLFGHNYEARYTQAEALPADLAEIVGGTSDPWKEEVVHAATMVTTTYHGDVCSRCGHLSKEQA